MNKIQKEFIAYIEMLCTTYLRCDKIDKLDSDESFTNELFIISAASVSVILSDSISFTWVSMSSEVNTTEVINNDGRPYTTGFILFDKFKLHIMVDPKMRFTYLRFWITRDVELTYTKDSYKMPERFEVLFF